MVNTKDEAKLKLYPRKVKKRTIEIKEEEIEPTQGEINRKHFAEKDMLDFKAANGRRLTEKRVVVKFEKEIIEEAKIYVKNIGNRLTAADFKQDDLDEEN